MQANCVVNSKEGKGTGLIKMLSSNKFEASDALGAIGFPLLKQPGSLGAQFLTPIFAPAGLAQMKSSSASFHPLGTEEI